MDEDLKEAEPCESVSEIDDLCDIKIALWSFLHMLAGITYFAAFVCLVLFPSVPDIPYTEIFAYCMGLCVAFFLFARHKKKFWISQSEKTQAVRKNEKNLLQLNNIGT